MIITNCPRCGAMNATTTCTKCGWSQVTISTVSTRITGEIEIKVSGKALLDDYKRLLLENRNLKERIAELKESDKHWAGNVKVCMQLIERYESAIAKLEEKQRWIPVSERLPEDKKHYMTVVMNCFDGSRDVYRLRYYGNGDWFSWASELNVVTHWKEEPELPEVQE